MLKIIGGEFRSRQLACPRGKEVTRPMASRVKESIFNILRGWFEDANVLDLYAGVGTMGLEAVSRGAKRVVMVEQDRSSFQLLEENIKTLGCGDRAEGVQGDGLSPMVKLHAPTPVDVVFLDPPYRIMHEEEDRQRVLSQIEDLHSILSEKSFVVLRTPEMDRSVDLSIPGYSGPEKHEYGHGMEVYFYMPLLVNDADSSTDEG